MVNYCTAVSFFSAVFAALITVDIHAFLGRTPLWNAGSNHLCRKL